MKKMKIFIMVNILVIGLIIFSCKQNVAPAESPAAPTITSTFTSTSTPATVEIKCLGTPTVCTNTYDTVIIEHTSNNYGGLGEVNLGFDGMNKRRILIKFDVSSIPATANIQEANLIINVASTDHAVSDPFIISVHKINSDWGEFTETWNTHNGGDFDINEIGTCNVTVIGQYIINLDSAVVQKWINGTIGNYGILLKQQTENTVSDYINISLKENIQENQRPKLVIKYIN